MNYLLVTHIPFRRAANGTAIVDGLWAEDLRGLAAAVTELTGAGGQLTVAAPEQPSGAANTGWGAGQTTLEPASGIAFTALPYFRRPAGAWLGALRLRRALARAVRHADLVHTSNFFPPYLGLAYAHRQAVKQGKKTLFVVAEDFVDFMTWNLAASGARGLSRWRSQRLISRQDLLCCDCLRSASVAFLHTPAAVARYRLAAPRALAIRQPVHEAADVVPAATLEQRLAERGPLRLVAACRLESFKGVDFILRALALLNAGHPDITLSIYGQGSQAEPLRRLAATLGIANRVHLHGPLPPGDEFRATLAAHDAALMPHLTNDFGRAFWDAMAAGLPVIAFRSTAADDTVRALEDGLLVPMADVQSLAEAIAGLDTNRALLATLSRNARARALANTKTIWNRIRLARIREEFPEDSLTEENEASNSNNC